MHFQNEFYYRLKQTTPEYRTRLYQMGCQLTQKGADVVLTVDEQHCSLWANIRYSKGITHAVGRKLAVSSTARVLSDLAS